MISSVVQDAFVESIREISVSLSISTDFISPPLSLQGHNTELQNIKRSFEDIYNSVPATHRNILNSSIILTSYAVYESYVHELMESFIEECCKISGSIGQLDEKLRRFHIQVVADRVSRAGKEESKILDSVSDAMKELQYHSSLTIPPHFDKSICRELHNNFRFSELNSCLSRIGANGFANFVIHSDNLQIALSKTNLCHDDIRIPLDDFVSTRNELMHSFDVSKAKGRDWIEEKLEFLKLIVSEINNFLGECLQTAMEDQLS
ncbi:MAE_28990/MAE_18760 family HEPN-like nuclease [Hyphomonas sp. UBA4494]|jgi:hypothetical protein|uniref:MAE_28990/MAE_18760 family HEPN-like nuclease n=1 Tax=Hyphomonas sp. UBA4494 TaxID=1946631 RepID=UPI0025BF2BD0|nr:MAE_28990/MAE_18760 family HEPN-like nuclease [Hyphomonas sp. UBA4494]